MQLRAHRWCGSRREVKDGDGPVAWRRQQQTTRIEAQRSKSCQIYSTAFYYPHENPVCRPSVSSPPPSLSPAAGMLVAWRGRVVHPLGERWGFNARIGHGSCCRFCDAHGGRRRCASSGKGRDVPSVGPTAVAAVVGGAGASLPHLLPTGMVRGMSIGVPAPSGHRFLGALRVPHGGGGGG